MIFKNLSIRFKILLLPSIALLLFAALETGDYYLKGRLKAIASENDICHRISLQLSQLMHMESDYIDTGNEQLLQKIRKKNKSITELLDTSRLFVPKYLDTSSGQSISSILKQHIREFEHVAKLQSNISKTNSDILALYNLRNQLVQAKTDEIIQLEFQLILTSGKAINSAKKEFANTLQELTGLDAIATLNTTELFHLADEKHYLEKENALLKRANIVLNAADALSVITEDDTDRDSWLEIFAHYKKINSLRENLYTLWKEKQELALNLPITDQALGNFSSFIIQRMQEESAAAEKFYNTYHGTTLILSILLLGFVSFFILRSILIPITKLTEGTKAIKDGKQDVQIDIANQDELGELATTFNEMVTTRKAMLKELEENERKFRQLLESTSTIPWELDLKSMQFTFVGKQAEALLGYPLASWVDFDSWANMIHPEDRDYATEYCKSATSRLEDHEFVYRMLHQNGSIVFIDDIVAVLADNGKPVKLVGFMHDITEKELAEKEKANLQERLQQAQKMEAIGTLAGGIAHDFNNLLGIILGYADMIKEDAPPGSPLADDLEKILQASYRARDLVQQILAFSRQSSTELQPFNPASIFKEALQMLRSSIPTTISIQENINPNCATILADPTQVHQILMNICTNSYHALEKGGGVLAISLDNTTVTEEDVHLKPHFNTGKFVELIIADDGPGIQPAIQEKIFDPFFTTKEVGKGTGMGLSIVHGIVTSYGGMIDFESTPGVGTTFHVYFPVADQEALDTKKSEETLPTGKERILLVDDEDLLIEMASDMLGRLGYDVTSRNNSIEALQAFENQPDDFDLVITDQTMPGMTGETLARRMLQIRPDIPIIICTGFSTVMSEEKAKSIGIKEFALKPLIKKDIAKLIRKVLEK